MGENVAPSPTEDLSWIDLVAGHFDFPKPLGEDEYIERWKREIDRTETLRNIYREVVEDLCDCAYKVEHRWIANADPHRADKAMYFSEIIYLSIRYAHACSKQHEWSRGMQAKVRQELRRALQQWSRLEKGNV